VIQRRVRFRCRLPCEILIGRRRRLAAEIVSLSEGGFGLQTDLDVAEGDALRIRVCPHRGRSAVDVTALVWNERKRFNARSGVMKRVLGCVVSEPPPAFHALVSELGNRQTPRRRLFRDEVPSRRHRSVDVLREAPPDLTLPRPKQPLPPPKPEPEETLPPFRVRAKQVGGPRSRSLRVRAQSAADAEARSVRELGPGWEILEVVPDTRPQKGGRGTPGRR